MGLQGRVKIEQITPSVDNGRYAAKVVIGDRVVVGADVFREGHELPSAVVQYRGPSDVEWCSEPLERDVNDRWYGAFPVDQIGAWQFRILAWTDHYASWLDALLKKHAAGATELDVEFEEGACLLERRRGCPDTEKRLAEAARFLRGQSSFLCGLPSVDERVELASDPALLAALEAHPERLDPTLSHELPLWVDREAAQFSAWYEFFPRSEGATATTSGTFADAAKRLAAIAEMGFDIVYLPPIHPIGRAFRKGRNNTLNPEPTDPGVPWAIGSEDGGHMSIHPDLGTIEDFDEFVAEAGRHELEIALDFAIQTSPDHPWAREHPEWFKHRPDGTIQYAENPPKKYQDIYPVDFDTTDFDNLRDELERVIRFWIAHGIRFFRVDNPHTKPLPFWEWLISRVHRDHPDVLFLSEAFTRPKMMKALAKLGFSQSYTYFAWRNTKKELVDYLTELSQTDTVDYFRPSFWTNTPDILTEYLQLGGPPAFKIRLVLAALLSPAYGIYSGFELYERVPLKPGSEEYLNSEKYQYKPRDWSDPDSLAPFIQKINRIRREHKAFRGLRNLRFHNIDSDQMLCFSKVEPNRANPVLVVVNLDPHSLRESIVRLDLPQLGLEDVGPFEAYELIADRSYIWHGADNYVRLDPLVEPAHILRLRAL
ncbi:MAG: alpha-1,4-glucan--maltose-1-phosphate maltosyltransferase [Egibacteraceae bacterium]